jgi:cell wall-associated NlpC family hydrolase
MTSSNRHGQELAKAATQFIGLRFQLYGRDPRQGLDCIGLVACSLEAIGRKPHSPTGYGLRNSSLTPWLNCAEKSGLTPISGAVESGDIVLIRPGPGQYHLVIAENSSSAIHAHAGIRKIVRQKIAFSELKTRHWRLL